jgi:hypothetical protein
MAGRTKSVNRGVEQVVAGNGAMEGERARLSGELERMSRVQAATQAEAEKAIMAMKASSTAAKNAKEPRRCQL